MKWNKSNEMKYIGEIEEMKEMGWNQMNEMNEMKYMNWHEMNEMKYMK